jgi:PAS domain S-box-containing protein
LVTDGQGRVLHVTAGLCDVLGLPAERIIGREAQALFRESCSHADGWLARTLDGQAQSDQTVRPPSAGLDGALLRLRSWALRDTQSRLVGLVAQVRPAGAPSAEDLQALLDSIPRIAGMITLDGTLVALNRQLAAELGTTVPKALGRRVYDLVHPDLAKAQRARHLQVLRTGKPLDFTYRSGKRWMHVLLQPVRDGDGKVSRIARFAHEVTDEKSLQEAVEGGQRTLDAILAQAPLMLLQVDGEGVVTFADGRGLVDAGLNPQEVVGRSLCEVFSDSPEIKSNLDRALKGESFLCVMQARGRVFECWHAPWRDADDKPCVLGVATDVTDRSRVQQELSHKDIALRELLHSVEKEKANLARAMDRNMETTIMPLLQDLEQGLPESHRPQMERLKASLQAITSPFVDRLSRQASALSPSEMRVCDMLRRGLSTKQIATTEHIAPATVAKHREHIRQKLQLVNSDTNLVTYLRGLSAS